MPRVGIIHLSDTQFGAKHTFGSPSQLSRALTEDILSLSTRFSFAPQYIVLSGDITEIGHHDEFSDALNQLSAIGSSLSVDPDSILVCPGNHDLFWPLAKVGRECGQPSLKYTNFNNFASTISRADKLEIGKGFFPVVVDHRNRILFLLIDSCHKEDDTYHGGMVDTKTLLATVEKQLNPTRTSRYLRVAVTHHRLDSRAASESSRVQNAEEVCAILSANKFQVVMTGHVHEPLISQTTEGREAMLFAGCGSTGVNKTQRDDGVPNQYTVLIVDTDNQKVSSVSRIYSPRSRTRFGLGGWVADPNQGSVDEFAVVMPQGGLQTAKHELVRDYAMEMRLRITSNPFKFSNAEKISRELIMRLFVIDDVRHKGAQRMSGDAIIRGPRGSGKTMFLRYLKIFGEVEFERSLAARETAESFPVLVNLSSIHRAELTTPADAYRAADSLIAQSVLSDLEACVERSRSAPLKAAFHLLRQRMSITTGPESEVSRLGSALREYMSPFFGHVLLLIDEMASVFPYKFFQSKDAGFLSWMNSIRNSGPFFTRVTIYPNDWSDILNEERFGTIVNLEYQIKADEEFVSFREYAKRIADRYLASVSLDPDHPTKLADIVQYPTAGDAVDDALEQLIYAADGSSRRLMSLLDRCIIHGSAESTLPLGKPAIFDIIRETANNLLTGYSTDERDLALSIAKVCKKNSSFRFRFPNAGEQLKRLWSAKEEFNIVKLVDPSPGAKGSTYEFAFAYCILNEIQTHYLKGGSRLCTTRDRATGEWISRATTITREVLEGVSAKKRIAGRIAQADENYVIIEDDAKNAYGASTDGLQLTLGDEVTFLTTEDGAAYDLLRIGDEAGP